jgi:hypothetical protein
MMKQLFLCPAENEGKSHDNARLKSAPCNLSQSSGQCCSALLSGFSYFCVPHALRPCENTRQDDIHGPSRRRRKGDRGKDPAQLSPSPCRLSDHRHRNRRILTASVRGLRMSISTTLRYLCRHPTGKKKPSGERRRTPERRRTEAQKQDQDPGDNQSASPAWQRAVDLPRLHTSNIPTEEKNWLPVTRTGNSSGGEPPLNITAFAKFHLIHPRTVKTLHQVRYIVGSQSALIAIAGALAYALNGGLSAAESSKLSALIVCGLLRSPLPVLRRACRMVSTISSPPPSGGLCVP